MGDEWLKSVEACLKEGGFPTEAGYPARKAAALTRTVAAVNLVAADGSGIREVLVTVLTPRKLGLAECQRRAAEAVALLSGDGNRWEFDRWRYEDGIGCWAVDIRGTAVHGVQVEVSVGDEAQPWVTEVTARQLPERRWIYSHAQGEPCGVIPGKKGWILKLTQLLPVGQPLPEEGEEPFGITVTRGGIRQVFRDCWWQSYTSTEKAEGTRIVRSAFCISREVSRIEQNGV